MSNNNNTNSGVSVASLVCALISFLCNPLGVLPLVAIILGIVGLATAHGRPKGCAIWGIILAAVAWVIQIITDILISVLSGGLGIFSMFL